MALSCVAGLAYVLAQIGLPVPKEILFGLAIGAGALGACIGLYLLAGFLQRRWPLGTLKSDRSKGEQFSFEANSPEQIKATIDAVYNNNPRADVPQLVNYLVFQAVAFNSSDIHLTPHRDCLMVRYRIDGILMDVAEIAERLKQPVINRLKVLSELVSYVRDRPQDGRFGVSIQGQQIDLRISLMPTLHGERVVMRLLIRADLGLGLENLGLTEEQLQTLGGILAKPQGMVILTGPTGSGKTKTIYSALQEILRQSQNSVSIYTLEDPIEYDLQHINQTQVEEGHDFTFGKALRTMLRQDPDIIMVGEIRDLDTARIAIQAGMTGHLIITTVHAKSAAAVPARLIEMGVDPHSVASAITAIIAQRLVRILCPHCKRAHPPTPGQEAKLGKKLPPGVLFYEPVGCPQCSMKGYVGRRGIFEILEVNESVRKLITERASSGQIHNAFFESEAKTLDENGLAYALKGETSLEELFRVLPSRKEFE